MRLFMDIDREMKRVERILNRFPFVYEKSDVRVDGNSILITENLAGTELEDISVTVDGTLLSIVVTENEKETFRNEYEITSKVNVDEIESEYKNGILKIRLPFSESKTKKTIKVN